MVDTASLIERRRQILLNTPHLTTESANPLTFQTDISANLKDCKIYFEPIQDLHGYDNPYPAGGGVNAIPYAVAKTEMVGGLTFSTGGKGTYTVTGTPTDIGYVYFDLIEPFTIPDGAVNKIYFFNNIVASQIQVAFINGTSVVDTWSINPAKRSANYSGMSNKPCTRIRIGCTNLNSTNPIDLTLKLMIVPNETVVTDYIPYENVCPITGWDGVTITRCGKNLFNYSERTSNYYLDTGIGEPVAQNGYYITPFIKVLANVPVYIPSSGSTRRWFYDENKVAKTYLKNSSDQVFTPTEDGYIRVSVAGTHVNASKYQIEHGSQATEYEPYTGTSLTIPFPQTIYGGYVDLVKGEVVEEWVKDVFVWENMTLADSNDEYTRKRDSTTYYSASPYSTRQMLNIGVKSNSNALDSSHFYVLTNVLQLVLPTDTPNETEIEVSYQLATPITHQLTPQTIKTLKDINNIWSNANGNIEVKFWKH